MKKEIEEIQVQNLRNAKLILDENLNLKKEIEEIQAQNLRRENAYNSMLNAKIFTLSYPLRAIYFEVKRFKLRNLPRKFIIFLAFYISSNPSKKQLILKIISPRNLYKLKKFIKNEKIYQKNEKPHHQNKSIDYKLQRLNNLNERFISENSN